MNGIENDFKIRYETEYTWTVVIKDEMIEEIVSVQEWTMAYAAVLTENDVEEMSSSLSLFGVALPVDTNGKFIENRIKLTGVDSLAEIKAGNVVYVYENANNEVARLDVGTVIIEGVIDIVNISISEPIVNGNSYLLAYFRELHGINYINSVEHPTATIEFMNRWVTNGDTVRLYLDDKGCIFSIGLEYPIEYNYAIVLEYQPADDISIIDGSLAKVKLFTADEEVITAEMPRYSSEYFVECPGTPVRYALKGDGKLGYIMTTGGDLAMYYAIVDECGFIEKACFLPVLRRIALWSRCAAAQASPFRQLFCQDTLRSSVLTKQPCGRDYTRIRFLRRFRLRIYGTLSAPISFLPLARSRCRR